MTIANSATSSDSYAVSGIDALTAGQIYHWRVKHFDNDGLNGAWNETSFFISSTTSEWLGGNLHRLVINTSIDPTLTNIPDFTFSTISVTHLILTHMVIHIYQSLHPHQASLNALLGFDLINYLLPDGVAVVESELKLASLSASGSPNVGVWAMSNHDWDQEEVTWLESSDGVAWSGPKVARMILQIY